MKYDWLQHYNKDVCLMLQNKIVLTEYVWKNQLPRFWCFSQNTTEIAFINPISSYFKQVLSSYITNLTFPTLTCIFLYPVYYPLPFCWLNLYPIRMWKILLKEKNCFLYKSSSCQSFHWVPLHCIVECDV